MSGKDGGYILPLSINPDRLPICIEIPDDPYHIAAFWGALDELTWSKNWQRDDAHTAAQVSRVWGEIIEAANDRFNAGERCGDPLQDSCSEYSGESPRVTFFPAIDAEELPLGYVVNPWVRLTGDNPLVGLKMGDVITDIFHIPPLPSIWDHLDDPAFILALGYPSISITDLVGSGTVRVHLVSLVLGGRCIVVKDNSIFSISFLDTNIDTVSLPPETYAENIIEYEFEGSSTHRLDMVFVPNVSAAIEFLGYGGGFRRVEICGFEENGMSGECCDELGIKIDETNKSLSAIYNLLKSGFKIVPLDFNLPSDFTVDCTPPMFDKGEGETDVPVLIKRHTALCLTVSRYVLSILYFLGKRSGFNTSTKAAILALMDIDAPPDFYPQLTMVDIEASLAQISRIAGTETNAFETVVCAMLQGLTGVDNTYANFKLSLANHETDDYPDNETKWLTAFVVAFNQDRNNYNLFAKQLDQSFSDLEELDYTCPCAVTECDPATLNIIPVNAGTAVTRIDDTHWHVTNHILTPSEVNPDIKYATAIVRDSAWRCFNHATSTQSQDSYIVHDCDGVEHTGTGGGGGVVVQSGWTSREFTSTDPDWFLDTIIEVTCP